MSMTRPTRHPPAPSLGADASQDSDLWAIYTRQCLGQVLDYSGKAALCMDPDIESMEPSHTQPARPAPRRGGGRR